MKRTLPVTLVLLTLLTSCGPSTGSIPVHLYGGGNGNGSLGLHTVRSGETVWTIAQIYKVELRSLLDSNHLMAPYRLTKGMRLNIPAPQTYTVKTGDTIAGVSSLFDTSPSMLVRLNGLRPSYALSKGQILKIPYKVNTPDHSAKRFAAPSSSLTRTGLATNASRPVGSAGGSVNAAAGQSGYSAPEPTAKRTSSSPEITSEPLPPMATQNNGSARSETTGPDISSQNMGGQDMARAGASAPPSKQAPQKISATPPMQGHFIKPVSGRVISGFGPKPDGLHNDGINIQAAKGDSVRASESGVVVYADSQLEGYGKLILLRHEDQYVTAYAHLDKILVRKGEVVKRGQAIGTVGTTGHVDKPQLHFEIRKGNEAIDPKAQIGL